MSIEISSHMMQVATRRYEMKVYVVTGFSIYMVNRLYRLFEPEVFMNREDAESEADTLIRDELALHDGEKGIQFRSKKVGDCDFDMDVDINSSGRLFSLKARTVDVSVQDIEKC